MRCETWSLGTTATNGRTGTNEKEKTYYRRRQYDFDDYIIDNICTCCLLVILLERNTMEKEKGIWSEFAEEELENNMPDDEEDTDEGS